MKLKRILAMVLCVAMVLSTMSFTVFADNSPVAKVGNTEYATIEEAIAAWTNGTTLTLLSDVTLSDVIKLSSTEHHILDLGTYTMTAAKNKDAIQYVVNGRATLGYALDIKADATNPGGITATGGSVVRHTKPLTGAASKDRPITRFYGGLFNASYVVRQGGTLGAGYTGASAPAFYFYGGEYNGTIYTNRSINQFYGGTFNGSMQMSVDSSAYTLIAGGTFKNLSNAMSSALNSDKFTIGSAKGNYDKEVYIDDNGNYVIAAAEPAEGIDAAVTKKPGTNDYLAYSKVATEGKLNYTDVYVALNKNNNASAEITVYVDELDMTDISYKGTIVVPEGEEVTIVVAEGTTPAWTIKSAVENEEPNVTYEDTNGNELVKGEDGSFELPAPSVINVATAEALQAALDNFTAGTTIQLAENVDYGVIYLRPSPSNPSTKGSTDRKFDWTGNNYGYESITVFEDMTIVGAEGSVIDAIEIEGGQYFNTEHSQSELYPVMCSLIELKNVTLDGITFTGEGGYDPQGHGNVLNFAGNNIKVNGLTVQNCVLNNEADNARLMYKTESTTATWNCICEGEAYTFVSSLANITVKNCTFNGGYMGLELRETENLTIEDNTFNGISSRDILLPVNTGCTYEGEVKIIGNISNGAGNRFVRASGIGAAALTIKDNQVVNYKGGDADFIKAEGVTGTYTVENNKLDGTVIEVTTDGNGVITVVKPVAKIGETSYATLEEAIAAAQVGDTITLLADITMTADAAYAINFSRKAVNIDGNGHKITQAADCDIDWALLYYQDSDPVTIKNLTFDGIKGGAAIWAINADINVENCVFQNGDHTQIQGFVRTTGSDATIKDSKFLDNSCNMIITFNFDLDASEASVDTLKVQNCEFKGNTCADTAAIYFVKGESSEISGNTFDNNKVDTTSHGAIAYYSEGQNGVVTNNVFSNNTIKAASARAGVLILEAGTSVSENAFVSNNVSSTASGDTFVGTVVNKADADSEGVTVNGNYWGGNEPDVANVKGAPTALDNYYTTYVDGTLGGLVETTTAVALVNGEEFTDLQEAIKAAAPGGTVEIVDDVVVDKWIMFAETMSIGNGNLITLNINGLTINGNNKTLTIKSIESAGNGNRLFYDAQKLNINDLTIKYVEDAANQGGIGLQSGTIENVNFVGGGNGVLPGAGNITIEGCDFTTNGAAIYYEEERDNLVVTGCEFTLPADKNVILLRGSTTFTNNIINSGRTVNVVSGSPVVTGNDFGDVRFKVYNEATATIENNEINVLAFNDESAVVNSTFGENTLSAEAQAVLDAAMAPAEKIVAKIGDEEYTTFADALENAVADDVITVYDTVILEEDGTIDLKGARVNAASTIVNAPVFRVLADVTFTNGIVDGRGPVAGEGGVNCYAFIVGNSETAGTLTINSGTYRGVTSAISITNGTVNILGGTFQTGHDEEGTDYGTTYLLNCNDAAYKAGNAVFNITGGKFVGFNPENNAAEGKNTNFLSGNYKASEYYDDDKWYVAKANIVMDDDKYFATIKDAFDTLKSADTTVHKVKVLSDLEIDVNYSTYNYPILINGFAIELDLNGKTLTADWSKYTGSRKDNALVGMANGAKLTVIDSVGGGEIRNMSDGKDDVENRIFWLSNAHAEKETILTIKAGTFIQEEDIHLLYVEGLTAGTDKKGYYTFIEGGHFEMVGYNDFFNSYDGRKHETEISGGTFNIDPTDWEIKIADGFKAEENPDGIWGIVEKKVLSGAGTQEDPYVINNIDDLRLFRDEVNAGNAYEGKYVLLTDDINLTDEVWTPIGTSIYDKTPADAKMFAGNFDGGNHTITGLTSKGYVPDAEDIGGGEYSFGLFGYVYGANISNVKLANVNIEGTTRQDSEGNDVGGSGVAALIGYYYVADGKACVVENCHVLSGTVSASNNMGGLIGFVDSQVSTPQNVDISIINCSNAADVTSEAREAGGIVGLLNASREDYSPTMAGNVRFKGCVNTGDITTLAGGGSTFAGGILGKDQNEYSNQQLKITFDDCENSGTITVNARGETHVAGIASSLYSHGAWLVVKNSKNTGNIVVVNPENADPLYAGGLLGYAGVMDVIESTSTGAVTVGTEAGNKYIGNVQNMVFVDGIDDFNTINTGDIYYLNGGASPEFEALVDDVANSGGNFNVIVKKAYKDGMEFGGWYDNKECTGTPVTAVAAGSDTYYAKWIGPAAKIGDTYYATFALALAAAQPGDVIEISAGEFNFADTTSITIDKAITIKGAGKDETTLNFDSSTSAFVIASSDVTFRDMTITQGTKDNSFHFSISKGAWDAPAVQYSNVTIENINFEGGDYALCLIGENVLVDSCTFTSQDSHNIIIYSVKGDSKITNNIFNPSTSPKTNRTAIYYEGGADNATDLSGFIGGGTLTVSGNEAYSKGLFFQFTNWHLVKDMNVVITNNKVDAFTNKAIALYDLDGEIIPAGDEFASVVISENVFTNVPSGRPIIKEYTGTVDVDASANYLGSAEPDVESLIVGDKTIVESYYSDEECETLVTISDEVGTKVAKVNGVEYETLKAAVDAAKAGDTITLLSDATIAEGTDVTIPDGVTLNGNGYSILSSGADHDTTTSYGYVTVGGALTIEGETKIEKFSMSYYDHSLTIGEGASLAVTGKNRVTLAYGSVINVTGNLENAKTADKTNLTPSLSIPAGISITGSNDSQLNVKNAYVSIGSTTSKNSATNGTIELNFENSIAEFTNQLTFAEPTNGMSPAFKLNVKDSVLTTGTKLIVAAPGTTTVIDNSTVTLSTYFRNSGKLTIKNGSVFTGGTIQFGENGGNDGETYVDASTLNITATSTGHALDGKSTGSVTLTNGAKANIDYVTNMGIYVDGKSCFTAKEILGTTTVTVDGSALEVGAEAKVIDLSGSASIEAMVTLTGNGLVATYGEDGDVTISKQEVPVASVTDAAGNVVNYADIQEALKALKSGDTLTLLDDITITEAWDNRYTGAKITVPVTIDGNGKTIKFTGAVGDGGNYHSAFRFQEAATVKNLTVDMSEATTTNNRLRAISSSANLTVDSCNFIGNATYTNCRAVIFGEGAGANVGNLEISITNSTFMGWKRGVVDNENGQDVKTVEVTGNTFTNAGVALSATDVITFTGNTVTNAYVTIKSYTQSETLEVVATGNTLTANDEEAGTMNYIDVATDNVTAQDDFYIVVPDPTGTISYRAYVNDSEDREAIQVDLSDVCAKESVVVKLLDAEGNVLTTTTLKAGGVEAANYTCNIVLWGSPSGSWDTVISAEKLTDSNIPETIELWCDGVLVDEFENALGAGTNVDETADYLALDCVSTETTELFRVEGTTASLDSSLALNIYVDSANLTGEDYYAVVEHTKVTGDVVTTTIPDSDWVTSGSYKAIRYTGIAAKEMADNIKITVYNADDTQASEAYETSLRTYALSTMKRYVDNGENDNLWLPALTDMLNYGAAAQTMFGYNTNDLATAGAEEFQQYATSTDVSLDKNGCELSDAVAGTTLTLEDMIKLNVYFKDVTEGMYAKYSYTTHDDRLIEKTVDYNSFISGWGYLGVSVDVAVADTNALVTVTMYNSDNSEAGKAVYSANAYLKDMIDKGEEDSLYPALAKFAASAKAAFANN